MKRFGWGFGVAVLMVVAGCQSGKSTPIKAPATTQMSSAAAAVSADDLRDLLADMAKAHQDKIELSTWAGTMVLPVRAEMKPFFGEMNKRNKELLAQLKGWGKEHDVDLTYRYSDDVDGHALKMMDDRQEKVIRADKQQDFERDILMEMWSDYDWHLCQAKALLAQTQDAGLKDYLEKTIAMLESGAGEIRELLKRYKFS